MHQLAPAQPVDEGVEAHLEVRLARVLGLGLLPRLVVDEAHLSAGRDVCPVDEAAQCQAVVEIRTDELLARRRLQLLRQFEGEVSLEQRAGLLLQAGDLVRAGEQLCDGLRVLLPQGVESGSDARDGRLDRALVRFRIEQPLEDRVDERAAERRLRGRLRQAIDAAQTELERALHEVVRARGGQSEQFGHAATVPVRWSGA